MQRYSKATHHGGESNPTCFPGNEKEPPTGNHPEEKEKAWESQPVQQRGKLVFGQEGRQGHWGRHLLLAWLLIELNSLELIVCLYWAKL